MMMLVNITVQHRPNNPIELPTVTQKGGGTGIHPPAGRSCARDSSVLDLFARALSTPPVLVYRHLCRHHTTKTSMTRTQNWKPCDRHDTGILSPPPARLSSYKHNDLSSFVCQYAQPSVTRPTYLLPLKQSASLWCFFPLFIFSRSANHPATNVAALCA